MREILFRGIAITGELKGKWVFGSYLVNEQADDKPPYEMVKEHYIDDRNGFERVDPETVGQYTGLKDKHGIRIYEGDIVCIKERGQTVNGEIIFVNGYPGGWLITDKNRESKCSLAMRTDVEVIGNIHDKRRTSNG